MRFLENSSRRGPWLVPAYCCPALVQTFSAARVAVEYYSLDQSLTPRWDELTQRIKRAPAAGIIFVHYFGFPTDWSRLKSAIATAGIPVIEDCAHLPLPEQPDPQHMPCAARIYSPRKWLPIPHGGALILKGVGFRAQSLFRSRTSSMLPDLLRASAFSAENHMGLNARGWLLSLSAIERRIENADAIDHEYGLSMDSRVAAFIQKNAPRASEIKWRQRANYEELCRRVERLDGVTIWRPTLSPDDAPFTFPLLFAPERRDSILKHCLRRGIVARAYWKTLPPAIAADSAFSDSLRLSRELICLPVHYRLGGTHLDMICEALLSATRHK